MTVTDSLSELGQMSPEIDYSRLKFETIKVDLRGHIVIVKLNRPQARNSWNVLMQEEIVKIYGLLDEDNRIKAVILSSLPVGNSFCVGADLSQGDFSSRGSGSEGPEAIFLPEEHRDTGGKAALAVHRLRKLTIAAINGDAVGIGITMTLPFDLRIVWSSAKIGFIFAKRAISSEACSSYFLPRLIGYSKALELFLKAEIIPATHPSLKQLFCRLIDQQVDVLPTAISLAEKLCEENSILSIVSIKQLVWHAFPTPEQQYLLESELMARLGNSNDSKESVKAFRAKRKARFSSKVPQDLVIRPWWNLIDVRNRVEVKSKL
ncbi:hypothetical protein CROQUDRAFT_658875 [Cronartium quercuum f. sp. fusiforme G11]|uniref:Enoyl-CoA hydratase n=1 Tax=Cronartium quercuum f. sp. fusiforme G11 TaxID=708437 RepID=A0A9P6TC55_9BASI|nr:hypothetical protein CROQUDRAFT_658875 [Cronartium quercuum f. sp. fusiforme G11]